MDEILPTATVNPFVLMLSQEFDATHAGEDGCGDDGHIGTPCVRLANHEPPHATVVQWV